MARLREVLEDAAPALGAVLLAIAAAGVPLRVEGLRAPPATGAIPAVPIAPVPQGPPPAVCAPPPAAAPTPVASLAPAGPPSGPVPSVIVPPPLQTTTTKTTIARKTVASPLSRALVSASDRPKPRAKVRRSTRPPSTRGSDAPRPGASSGAPSAEAPKRPRAGLPKAVADQEVPPGSAYPPDWAAFSRLY